LRRRRATPPVAELPRCAWRECVEPATWSLGYGRDIRDELLFVDYCDTHAAEAESLFCVEARTAAASRPAVTQRDGLAHAPSPDLVPRYARPREALVAESAFVQGALLK
jgi:hypothetical protein